MTLPGAKFFLPGAAMLTMLVTNLSCRAATTRGQLHSLAHRRVQGTRPKRERRAHLLAALALLLEDADHVALDDERQVLLVPDGERTVLGAALLADGELLGLARREGTSGRGRAGVVVCEREEGRASA